MKIGIVTFHDSKNYGALFQAYSLREYLLRKGFDVSIINYVPPHLEGDTFPGVKVVLKHPKSFFTFISNVLFKVLWRFRVGRKVASSFEDFLKNNMGIKKPKIRFAADLPILSELYTVIICGSDQIWSPFPHFGYDPLYFLHNSVFENSVKVSYAPSFGDISVAWTGLAGISPYLNSINFLSCREKEGQELTAVATGREVALVPDPVILLNDFTQFLDGVSTENKNVVFVYALRTKKNIAEVSYKVSSLISASVVSPINFRQKWFSIGKPLSLGPLEWLEGINSCRFVVTNSFHGVVFSIVLKKSFIYVPLAGKRLNLNSRALNLIEFLGLQKRVVFDSSYEDLERLVSSDIDWVAVDSRLSTLRGYGIAFLERAIQSSV
jgi:hypothetical protein